MFSIGTAILALHACDNPSIDLRKVTVGFKCRTSKGAVFERVKRPGLGEAWKGEGGQVWSDRIANADQYFAESHCSSVNASLPSADDFSVGEAQGFREVLPNMRNRAYWSRNVAQMNSIEDFVGIAFVGDDGAIGADHQDSEFSVRCVVTEWPEQN
jgi:hypothetical protein